MKMLEMANQEKAQIKTRTSYNEQENEISYQNHHHYFWQIYIKE